jgi:hypothetical protein
MIINPYLVQPSGPSFTGLLDTYSGSSAAYSAARRLSSTYTGALIRVRRSSDNTEQDIGYDGSNVLDESALTTFVGAGNGFVTTWYDQSGNGRNQSQSTAANQPRIVNSGVIDKLNSKPCIRFTDASSRFLAAASNTYLGITDCLSTFSVGNYVGAGGSFGMIISKGYGEQGAYSINQNSGNNQMAIWIETENTVIPVTTNKNTQYLWSNTNAVGSNGIKFYQNNSLAHQYTTSTDLIGTNSFKSNIGRNEKDASYYLDGNLQEIVLFSTYQQSNVTAINTNINTFYSIY